SKFPLKLPGLAKDVDGPSPLSIDVPKRATLTRFAMSRLIDRIAIEPGGGERLAETKEVLFGACCSMSQQRDGMRPRRCGGESNRRRVSGQHHVFNTDARLDDSRQYRSQNEGDDGCRNEPTVSTSAHVFADAG